MANRTCGGYEDGLNRVFHQYDQQDANPLPFKSIARKCSLPVRISSSNSNVMPEDSRPQEITDEKVEELALRAFVYDYCINSINLNLSKGYLNGLESMLHSLGWQSDVAKACKVVAFANHGIAKCRPGLSRKAGVLYHDLLGTLAEAIQDPANGNTTESLTIAMLLGFYEV